MMLQTSFEVVGDIYASSDKKDAVNYYKRSALNHLIDLMESKNLFQIENRFVYLDVLNNSHTFDYEISKVRMNEENLVLDRVQTIMTLRVEEK